jgi:hypothetical protein
MNQINSLGFSVHLIICLHCSLFSQSFKMPQPNTSTTPAISTKADCAVTAVGDLYEASYRLQNICKVLESYVKLVVDDSTSKNKIKNESQTIKRVVLPSISLIVDKLVQSGKHVSPIASLKVVSDSLERVRVREVVDPKNKYKSHDLQMLYHYVNPSTTKSVSPEPAKRAYVLRHHPCLVDQTRKLINQKPQ